MAEMARWAIVEFGRAELGDKRLENRLVVLASQRGANPNGSISESCGDPSDTRAAYRFYDNDDVGAEEILASHREATIRRATEYPVILAVQDTTMVDLTDHPHTEGTGYLDDINHSGYLVHTTLLVTPDRIPLGIMDQKNWVRDANDFGKKKDRKKKPTEQKESQKWLNGLQATIEAQSQLPNTQLVCVGDCEADIFALYAASVDSGVSFLIRAYQNRVIENEDERHLWAHIKNLPVVGIREVEVPRQANRPERVAKLAIRMAKVELIAPEAGKARQKQQKVTAWAILACEEQPPDDIEPIEWKLLTNYPTESIEQAIERVDWYACRWMVEIFHRTLKTGCRLEERQFDDMENIKRFLAVDSVVAWHVMFATMVPRKTPNISCEILFSTAEWQAVFMFSYKKKALPTTPPTLEVMIRLVARLGGFTASSKVSPGPMVLWRGFSRLNDITQAWLLFRSPY